MITIHPIQFGHLASDLAPNRIGRLKVFYFVFVDVIFEVINTLIPRIHQLGHQLQGTSSIRRPELIQNILKRFSRGCITHSFILPLMEEPFTAACEECAESPSDATSSRVHRMAGSPLETFG